MRGQLAHRPSSTVRSGFSRKKGTTSTRPALVTVFLPHEAKVADALAASGVPSTGALGWPAKLAIVSISLWKCFSKGS